MHGGGGLNARYLERGRWWADQGYVALVIDSYGSRGLAENWLTWGRFGANMRAADTIGAVVRHVRAQSRHRGEPRGLGGVACPHR